ncbi:MAG: glycosyltransferase family 9 protein [Nitrospira sp.]
MPHEPSPEHRDLVIQMARLGDLVQTLPAIESLQEAYPERRLDVLCAAPLIGVLAAIRGIGRVIPWDGAQWRTWAIHWQENPTATLQVMQRYLASLSDTTYERVYSLNQHARSHLMTQLFLRQYSREPEQGRIEARMRPWAQHLRHVARERGANRVHLADAWCGMCGVLPLGQAPSCVPPAVELPADLAEVGERQGRWVALVTGAGEADRCVTPAVWSQWIREFLSQTQDGQIVLIGSGTERETAQAILDSVPTLLRGRVWDATGRTNISQLMHVLHQCHWIIGADTGPLHLGTLVGTRAMAWYFSRARVHETGPYGEGHWVYQHPTQAQPQRWPIMESIALMCGDQGRRGADWTLWRSGMDRWGVYFDDGSGKEAVESSRAAIWRACAPALCESMAA